MIYFSFNGKCSTEFDILVEESNHYTKAEKRIEFIEVPGRTGDLIIYDNSRKNITIEITCSMDITNKQAQINEIDKWLNAHSGYKELIFYGEDGIQKAKFQAVFIGELVLPDTHISYSDFTLEFSAYEVVDK